MALGQNHKEIRLIRGGQVSKKARFNQIMRQRCSPDAVDEWRAGGGIERVMIWAACENFGVCGLG